MVQIYTKKSSIRIFKRGRNFCLQLYFFFEREGAQVSKRQREREFHKGQRERERERKREKEAGLTQSGA